MARKNPGLAQIKIRLPVKLRRTLEREARKNDRTLNGEIVYRLSEPIAVMEATERVTNKLMDQFFWRIGQMKPPGGQPSAPSKPETGRFPALRRAADNEDDVDEVARQPTRRTIKTRGKDND